MLSNKLWNMLVARTKFLNDYIGKTYNFSKYGTCKVKNFTLSTQLELENESKHTIMVWFDEVKEELNRG